MIKIDTLPNYCNGRLYKRWDSVKEIFQHGSFLACKTDSKGSTVQLFLTEGGSKRELYFPDGKIMDVIDDKGTKRVYNYERLDNNTIKGQMIAGVDKYGRNPLILGAKWILKNMLPEKLILKINKEHPQSQIFIPQKSPDGTCVYTGKIEKLHVSEIMAKDFCNSSNLTPKTILLKTFNGTVEHALSESGDENLPIAQHFGFESEILGQNIRTIV